MAIKIADEKSERKASWAWCSLQPLTGLERHQVSVPVDILLAPLGAKIPRSSGYHPDRSMVSRSISRARASISASVILAIKDPAQLRKNVSGQVAR